MLGSHGTCFYHRFFWFEFRIHNNGISVLFCLQNTIITSARCAHLAALKRTTAAFILLFGINHPRFYGLAAWAVFYVPDLFGICHLLLVLWAYSYLCRFISTVPGVTQIGPSLCFGWFFLVCCFTLFEKCVVISLLSVFCSCYQSGRTGAGLLNYTRYTLSVTGFLDRPGWWLPFTPFISFFQFRFRAITRGICALPSW